MTLTVDNVLRPKDTKALMRALTRSGQPFSDQHLRKVLDWAMGIKIEAEILDLVLKGRMAVRVREDGEVAVTQNQEEVTHA
jgi:hypothetical protein